MPNLVSEIATSLDDTLNPSSNTPGGWQLQNHAQENSSSLIAINQQDWDYVVIQAQSQEPSFPPFQVEQATYPHAQTLVEAILSNDSCTEPMFFMTWGRKNGDAVNGQNYPPVSTYLGMQSRLRNSYLEMAFDNNSSVSPVGMAWKKSIELNPDFELYAGDESHPNLAGSYLSACVFYSSIFKKSCVGSNFYPAGLDSLDALYLQTIASDVVLDSTQVWNLFDVQNIELTQVSETYDFSVQASNYDSISWDFGDGEFSDQENISHTYALDQQYTVQLSVFSKNNCKRLDYFYNIDTFNVSDIKDFSTIVNGFPNPTQRFFNIEILEPSFIELYDLNGKKLMNYKKDNSFKLDLKDIPNGIYHVKVIGGKEIENFKILKNE